jgi:hypothetical protein
MSLRNNIFELEPSSGARVCTERILFENSRFEGAQRNIISVLAPPDSGPQRAMISSQQNRGRKWLAATQPKGMLSWDNKATTP